MSRREAERFRVTRSILRDGTICATHIAYGLQIVAMCEAH